MAFHNRRARRRWNAYRSLCRKKSGLFGSHPKRGSDEKLIEEVTTSLICQRGPADAFPFDNRHSDIRDAHLDNLIAPPLRLLIERVARDVIEPLRGRRG